MTNFFEKLKKGMGIEEEKEKEKEEKPKEVKVKMEKVKKIEVKKEEEGELAIDLYQTEEDLVLQSAIAGVKPEDLEIEIEGDMLTIRGKREKPFEEKGEYLTQECYWGPFSRKIILPVEVDIDKAEAEIKNGILTIRIKKTKKEKKKKILVKG